MEERRCPKCEGPISREDKFCSGCGVVLSQAEASPLSPPAKQGPSTGKLLIVFSLIIAGLVTAGALAIYFLFSNVSSEEWKAFAAPKPEIAAPVPDRSPDVEVPAYAQEKALELEALPPIAPADRYMALGSNIFAEYSGDTVVFSIELQNISDVICAGAGVELELYDAEANCVGKSGNWVYQEIQPGEFVRLSFGNFSNRNIRSFRLTRVAGQLALEADSSEASASDSVLSEPDVPAASESELPLKEGLTLLGDVTKSPLGGVGCYLQGRIRNDSGKKHRSVFVDFVIYDAAGDQVGTASAITKDFNSGVVWKFSALATVPPQNAVTYEISDITVY